MRTILRDNYTPEMGAYHEILIIDEARHKKYLFDCDGVFTDITNPLVVSERGDSEDFAASQKWVTDIDDKVDGLAEDLGDEIQARTDADDAIWAEIEEIEMSSDVVDIVGTYAELQQYDTSKLHDNDIIKVLQDETHQNETAYYRWSTATDTFSYVGSEGPYYTESEVDALLGDKQDTLIAGSNIQIAADGKTISATDTTYSDFTGATAQEAGAQGLVPAPATSDRAKFLKGDGTWSNTDRFVHNKSTNDNIDTFEYYIDSSDMQHRIGVTITRDNTDYSIENVRMYLDDDDPALNILPEDKTQHKLVAGSNIQIASDGKTISATDTTYSDFTGATASTDGVQGLVPGPLAGDEDKFLKADGTWATVGGGSGEDSVNSLFLNKGSGNQQYPIQSGSDEEQRLCKIINDYLTGNNKNFLISLEKDGGGVPRVSFSISNIVETENYACFWFSLINTKTRSSSNTYYGVTYRDFGFLRLEVYVRKDEYDRMNVQEVFSDRNFTLKNFFLTSLPSDTLWGIVETSLNGLPLGTTNTSSYTPTQDYHPATKKYVDTAVASAAANTISSQDWSDLWQ